MPIYTYQARDSRGDLISDTIEAASTTAASQALRREGKYVLELSLRLATGTGHSTIEEFKNRQAAKGTKREHVIEFCHQLSIMLETGVPLSEALQSMLAHSSTPGFRRIVQSINDDVTGGSKLSSSLLRWPHVFPPLMIALIKASEVSGTMGLMLGRVSNYLTKELKTAKQIKGAMTYPCVMMTLAIVITIFLMTFVLPRFAAIYSNRSAALPMPTQIMLGISAFFKLYWLYIIIGSVGVITAILVIRKKPFGRRCIDWIKLNCPVVSRMYRELFLSRASRTMATLLASGVDLLDTVEITKGVTDNIYFEELWDRVSEDLQQGKSMHTTLKTTNLISPNITQMIAAGDKAGRLGQVLERVGEVSEEHLDDAVAKATQYIEPIMISAMGVIIGFVAIALLLPIFTISNAMH